MRPTTAPQKLTNGAPVSPRNATARLLLSMILLFLLSATIVLDQTEENGSIWTAPNLRVPGTPTNHPTVPLMEATLTLPISALRPMKLAVPAEVALSKTSWRRS